MPGPDPPPLSIRLHRAVMAAALLVPAVVFSAAAWWNRGEVLREGTERIERTVAIMHQHAVKIFDTADLMLGRIDEHLRGLDWAQIAAPGTSEFLKGLTTPRTQLVSAWVTDPAGIVQAGSQPWQLGTGPGTRDFFLVQRDRDAGTYLSAAFTGLATRTVSFALSRRRSSADGRFDGVIHVALSPDYFAGFFHEAAPEQEHVAILLRADGEILARDPANALKTIKRFGPDSLMMRSIAQSPAGGLRRGVSTLDGRDRIFAFRQVGAYPAYVAFGVDMDTLLAPWRRNLLIYGAVAGGAALTLLLVSWLALRRAQAEQAALRQAAEEAERRRSAEERLHQSQKMESVGQLTGGIAHDFNNHLAVVVGSLQLLRRKLERGEADAGRYIEAALEGAERAAALTRRLLAFSRRMALEPKALDANRLIAGMAELLRRTLGERITVQTGLAGDLWPVHADASQLENAILNLALNARDAIAGDGRVTVATANRHLATPPADDPEALPAGDYVVISVADTGTGMPPEVVARAFEPFFTTKEAGRGTGLGLPQVYGFARQSGGRVEIESAPGQGTTVRLWLPRHAGPLASEPPPPEAPAPQIGQGELVLVVEDDDRVRRMSTAALRELGFRVLEAARPSAALRLLDAHPEIELLFTDLVMPEMDGRRLAEEALRLRPRLKVLFTSGHSRDIPLEAGPGEAPIRLLKKPFTLEALAAELRELTGQTV